MFPVDATDFRSAARRFAVALLLSSILSTPIQATPRASDAVAPVTGRSGKDQPVSAVAIDLLSRGIGAHRLVLLGEMHGTREIPVLVGDLVARYAGNDEPLVLALEIDSREQPRIDRYLMSSGSDTDRRALLAGDHWQDPMHDGRDSEAMLALMERVRLLRAQHSELWILAFDRNGRGTRDARMAAALRDAVMHRPAARLLVLTGNIHAMVRAPKDLMLDGNPIEPPLSAGTQLSDLAPLSISITALGGESVICQPSCAIQPVQGSGASTAPAFESNGDTSPWDATLTLLRFTPSPAAVGAESARSTR